MTVKASLGEEVGEDAAPVVDELHEQVVLVLAGQKRFLHGDHLLMRLFFSAGRPRHHGKARG